jgi:hypothetical protein
VGAELNQRVEGTEARARCPGASLMRLEAVDAGDSDRIERACRAQLRLSLEPFWCVGYPDDDD